MRVRFARHVVLTLAGVLLGGALAGAQGAGNMGMESGPGPGPGFGRDRAPFEQAFGPGGREGRWWNNPRVAERLKLTEDQRKAMDGILYDHREKLIDLQANLEKAELAMQPLMSADQPNEAGIDAQIDKVVQARADLERANARFLLAIRMKLTPEQWKEVREFHAEMAGRMRDRGGPGPRRQWRGRPGAGPGAQPGGGPSAPPDAQPGNSPPPPPADGPQAPGTGQEQ